MPRRPVQGFTLIELMVVVAIIVALLAILLPSMGKAVAAAERTVCASNLDQIGTAVTSYLADTFGRYPNKGGSMYSWFGKKGSLYLTTLGADQRPLNKYTGTYRPNDQVPIARCPRDGGAEYGGGSISSYDAQGTSFGSNTHVGIPSLVDSTGYGIRITQVRSPSRLVAMGENPAYASAWWTVAQWAVNAHSGMFWHGDPFRWNIAFADGHVAYPRILNAEIDGSDYTFHRDH